MLIEVDGRPVLVLHGSRPAWRTMRSGVDDGPDIEQLEAALVALGYASADDLEIDEEWTADTTTAVKTMQTWLDRPVTGRIEVGDVVFHDGPVRVAEIAGELGDAASAAGISITGIDQFVAMSVDASDVDAFEVDGDAEPTLEVELPSGETMLASVAEIGVPQTSQDGSTSVAVLLTLEGDATAILDGTPVAVHVVDVAAEGVLTVPAEALLALAEGGYAVEVVEGATTRLVPVQVGVFADGRVEIEGDIAEGTDVVTA